MNECCFGRGRKLLRLEFIQMVLRVLRNIFSFGGDTVSTGMFGLEEPPAFHAVYKSFDLVSVLYAGNDWAGHEHRMTGPRKKFFTQL